MNTRFTERGSTADLNWQKNQDLTTGQLILCSLRGRKKKKRRKRNKGLETCGTPSSVPTKK